MRSTAHNICLNLWSVREKAHFCEECNEKKAFFCCNIGLLFRRIQERMDSRSSFHLMNNAWAAMDFAHHSNEWQTSIDSNYLPSDYSLKMPYILIMKSWTELRMVLFSLRFIHRNCHFFHWTGIVAPHRNITLVVYSLLFQSFYRSAYFAHSLVYQIKKHLTPPSEHNIHILASCTHFTTHFYSNMLVQNF